MLAVFINVVLLSSFQSDPLFFCMNSFVVFYWIGAIVSFTSLLDNVFEHLIITIKLFFKKLGQLQLLPMTLFPFDGPFLIQDTCLEISLDEILVCGLIFYVQLLGEFFHVVDFRLLMVFFVKTYTEISPKCMKSWEQMPYRNVLKRIQSLNPSFCINNLLLS